jgi:hypothetical protein
MSYPLHPIGDMLFNPLAKRGDADYGNLYVAVGDGTAGERAGVTHAIPQRLDALTGKILRITPDISLRPADRLSANGRYRIPSTGANANPFLSAPNARGEIYAYGFRNPHKLTWDPVTNTFIAVDIGHRSWEEINIVTRGGNYGWAEREGPEAVFIGGPNDSKTATQVDRNAVLPSPDTLVVEGLEQAGCADLSRGGIQSSRGDRDRQRVRVSRHADAATCRQVRLLRDRYRPCLL